jgi:hypothetical protein
LYQDSIQVKIYKRASVFVFNDRLSISSHSKVAKKPSAMALSYAALAKRHAGVLTPEANKLDHVLAKFGRVGPSSLAHF